MKPADLRAIVEAMTPSSGYGYEFAYNNAGCPTADLLIPGHNRHETVEMMLSDAAGIVALRNHATAHCDLAEAVLRMLEAADIGTEEVYRRMDALRQAYAKLEAVLP